MTQEKFTPGPWEVIKYGDSQYSIYNTGHGYEERYIPEDTDEANANLIAAAPDMYGALKIAYKSLQSYGNHPLIDPLIEAALNKANPQ